MSKRVIVIPLTIVLLSGCASTNIDTDNAGYVSLFNGRPTIAIRTVFDNRAEDHRLRVLFPTPFRPRTVNAAGHFHVIERSVDKPSGVGWVERPSPTDHQLEYVSLSNGRRGLTLINRGLPEYEVIKGKKGHTLALTLLRAVGWLSRDDFITRKGHAGPGFPAVEAQCPGENSYEYSLLFHPGDWRRARAWRFAHDFNSPLVARQADSREDGGQPAQMSLLSLAPDNLVISAVKKAEDDKGIVVRFWNTTAEETRGELSFYRKLKAAYLANMNEERGRRLSLVGGRGVKLKVRGFEVVTLKLYC